MRKLIIGLSIACVVLATISIILAVALYRKPRFVQAGGSSPYLMFDNKTAQACWSGPKASHNPLVELFDKRDSTELPKPPAEVPFCVDLK
jgi:hypothetical protein